MKVDLNPNATIHQHNMHSEPTNARKRWVKVGKMHMTIKTSSTNNQALQNCHIKTISAMPNFSESDASLWSILSLLLLPWWIFTVRVQSFSTGSTIALGSVGIGKVRKKDKLVMQIDVHYLLILKILPELAWTWLQPAARHCTHERFCKKLEF